MKFITILAFVAISNALLGGWKEEDPNLFMLQDENGKPFIAAMQKVFMDAGTDYELDKINKVYTQIVNGKNFLFEITIQKDDNKKTYNVIVYQDLQGQLEITSFKEVFEEGNGQDPSDL